VAPRTLPKTPAPVRLPKLRVAIYDRGELVEVKEYDDPRVSFCREFNERGSYAGLTALPLFGSAPMRRKAVGQ